MLSIRNQETYCYFTLFSNKHIIDSRAGYHPKQYCNTITIPDRRYDTALRYMIGTSLLCNTMYIIIFLYNTISMGVNKSYMFINNMLAYYAFA